MKSSDSASSAEGACRSSGRITDFRGQRCRPSPRSRSQPYTASSQDIASSVSPPPCHGILGPGSVANRIVSALQAGWPNAGCRMRIARERKPSVSICHEFEGGPNRCRGVLGCRPTPKQPTHLKFLQAILPPELMTCVVLHRVIQDLAFFPWRCACYTLLCANRLLRRRGACRRVQTFTSSHPNGEVHKRPFFRCASPDACFRHAHARNIVPGNTSASEPTASK